MIISISSVHPKYSWRNHDIVGLFKIEVPRLHHGLGWRRHFADKNGASICHSRGVRIALIYVNNMNISLRGIYLNARLAKNAYIIYGRQTKGVSLPLSHSVAEIS